MKAKCIKTIKDKDITLFTINKIYNINDITITCEKCGGCDEDENPCNYETIDDDNTEHFLTEDYLIKHFVWF